MTRRRSLTVRQRLQIWERHAGTCHICKQKIRASQGEKWEADHIIPRALTGKDELAEFAPAHVHCHLVKTKTDVRDIAKGVRLRAKNLGIRKARVWQRYKKKLPNRNNPNGEVVYRDTGQPVRRT